MHRKEAAELLKALGHEVRIRIIKVVLKKQDITASDLIKIVGCTQPTLSHHTKILVDAGLIKLRRDWKWVHYSANVDLINELAAFISTPCCCCDRE
ncbi:MAG: metalloregulator ArsR/SmtB family transcription factor [Candidatus Enteromonas sp.]|nr:metalloregulator ArsR/SmtB family transcription factor [Candidatus Enteromonas sp.]